MSEHRCGTCKHVAVLLDREPCADCSVPRSGDRWEPKKPTARVLAEGVVEAYFLNDAEAVLNHPVLTYHITEAIERYHREASE